MAVACLKITYSIRRSDYFIFTTDLAYLYCSICFQDLNMDKGKGNAAFANVFALKLASFVVNNDARRHKFTERFEKNIYVNKKNNSRRVPTSRNEIERDSSKA